MFDKLFNKFSNDTKEEIKLDENKMPQHIAIIMDGNGRWAQKRGLPRVAGHKRGMEVVKDITKTASGLGVKVLTLYAFSTENWKRPKKEVNFLMDLPVKFFDTFVPELIENNIKVNVMGYTEYLPEKTQKAVNDAIEQTKNNTGMILNFALNYGSRAEIITAVKKIALDVKNQKLAVDEIDEDVISKSLMTQSVAPYNDPELLIRTSGEERISNFLLWQLAYSELVFSDKFWPEYKPSDLIEDINKYQHRDRRFGGVKEGK
nr:isoprenyl transferase [uncultured Ligilactobacillus sp.]